MLKVMILGTTLGFYRIIEGAYVSPVLVVNLDNPGITDTKRVVKVVVEQYGLDHVVEVTKGFSRTEKLKRRDRDEAQAQCLADLLKIGMGASVRGMSYTTLVEECRRNAEEASKCF